MSKRRSVQASGFEAIVSEHREAHGEKPAKVKSSPPETVGKSKDSNYVKLTCYIRKDTHLGAKKKLLDKGGGQLSDLVEELMTNWLRK